MAQANAILTAETRTAARSAAPRPVRTRRCRRSTRSTTASSRPPTGLLRTIEPWSSYVVLPVFALANAGVALVAGVFGGHESLMLAIVAGLVVGKPLGFMVASALAVRPGLAMKPPGYSWRQLARRGRAGRHRLHDVAVHRRPGVPGRRRFRRRRRSRCSARRSCRRVIGVALLWRPLQPGAMDAESNGGATDHTHIDDGGGSVTRGQERTDA